jgi:hypothetical protein
MTSTQSQSMTVLRWMGAIGITLAPLGLFVIPGLMYPEPVETAEEQFRAIAEGSGGGYPALLAQIFGVVFLLAAALGIGGVAIARGRGRTLGAIGLVTGVLTAISLLVVLGFELATLTALISATDTDAAVALVAALSSGPVFTIPLLIGLVGFFLTLPILALALWRSGMVPIVVPLLFVLPVLIGFVPLPFDPTVVSGLLLVLPCLWMTAQLIRGVPVAPTTRPLTVPASDHA